jgi:NADH-quinone oxidoreductase subunit N
LQNQILNQHFDSKFYIFLAALENGSYILLFTGILTSVISAFYYIRIIKSIFFESKNQSFYLKQLDYKNTIVLMVSTSFLILFIFVLKFFIMLTNFVALILIN